MKNTVLLLAIISSLLTHAQPSMADSGTFFLHKFAQNIGKETYHLTRTGAVLQYDVDFRFVDRGNPVPLKARLEVTPSFEPISLLIKGSTSRFSTIDDSIRIRGKQAGVRVNDSTYTQPVPANSFPVGGYSPGTVQMVLLQYWKKHGQPATINLLPAGKVAIKKIGQDTLSFSGQPLVLQRYVISGLVWGNELVWTDTKGDLVCLITNDAEGDKMEMMLAKYETLLPELISRAATYGMQLFTASMQSIDMKQHGILVITGANILDVDGEPSVRNAVIVIENGLIRKIAAAGSFPIPAGAKVIDASGKTVLPGLWDMHAHFQQAEWGPAYLAAGVTTVRDCGNEFEYINSIQRAIDAGKGVGPHILKAGIIDGPGPSGIGIIRAATKEEAIRAVRLYKENGFAQIKIYSSVTPGIVKAIADEAKRQGLEVTGHIPEGMTLQQGVDSGMTQVNHIQYVYSVMKKNKDRSVDLTDSSNIRVLDFIKDHHVVIDPTVGVYEFIFRSTSDEITHMEPNYYSLPVPLQALYKNMGMPEEQAAKFRPMMKSLLEILKALHDKGVTIVAGTDMGFPGFSVARELELYVQAGLTPLEAIRSATIIPARVMKLDKEYGSVREGKQADLVIIDGDPLKNIKEVRKVVTIIKSGRDYSPTELHLLAGFLK